MFCPKCGQKIEDNQSFCAQCGFSLTDSDERRGNDRNENEEKQKDQKQSKPGKSKAVKIGLAILALLAAGGGIGLYVFVSHHNTSYDHAFIAEETTVRDLCRAYAADYEVIDESTNTIQVEGPDFGKLLEFLPEEETQDISAKTIERLITEHPEAVKKYVFTVAMIDKTEVENAFLDQVAYELIMVSMKDMKIIEEWSSDR